MADRSGWPDWFASLTRQNETLGSIPAADGNTATLIGDYRGSIDAMAAEIDTAERFVHVEFFIVAKDVTTSGFFDAMERAVQRGVSVRLLADFIASKKMAGSKETFAELDRIGVKWRYMLPVRPLKGKYSRPDLRNHRKLVVVDGRVGFMGSQNLIDRSYNSPKNIKRGLQWQELMTRVTGPIVASINGVFLSDWYSRPASCSSTPSTCPRPRCPRTRRADALVCQVVPSGPAYEGENNLRMFLTLVTSRAAEGDHHQPLLRSGRGDGVRDHVGLPAGSRRAVVRLGDRRPGVRLARAALVLQAPAEGRGARSGSTRRRTSCTPSTCRSTTTSP